MHICGSVCPMCTHYQVISCHTMSTYPSNNITLYCGAVLTTHTRVCVYMTCIQIYIIHRHSLLLKRS